MLVHVCCKSCTETQKLFPERLPVEQATIEFENFEFLLLDAFTIINNGMPGIVAGALILKDMSKMLRYTYFTVHPLQSQEAERDCGCR